MIRSNISIKAQAAPTVEGVCEICGAETTVRKHSLFYDINCTCHQGFHKEELLCCDCCAKYPSSFIRSCLKLKGFTTTAIFVTPIREIPHCKHPNGVLLNWHQPDRKEIKITNEYAIMTKATFNNLINLEHNYLKDSFPGKLWRAGNHLYWLSQAKDRKYCELHNIQIAISDPDSVNQTSFEERKLPFISRLLNIFK